MRRLCTVLLLVAFILTGWLVNVYSQGTKVVNFDNSNYQIFINSDGSATIEVHNSEYISQMSNGDLAIKGGNNGNN